MGEKSGSGLCVYYQSARVIDWNEAKAVDRHPHFHQGCSLESWQVGVYHNEQG